MGQRRDYAAKWAAQVKLRLEECALGMGQRSNYAPVKDARIKLREEGYARGTGERRNYAAVLVTGASQTSVMLQ